MNSTNYEKWSFDFHLKSERRLMTGCSAEPEAGIHPDTLRHISVESRYAHGLHIFNPLRDLMLHCVMLAPNIKNKNAEYYLKYGVGRRGGMMFRAFQTLLHVAEPHRSTPLTHDEQQQLSVHVNTIYINIRGCLDNLAWTYGWETNPDVMESCNPMHVNLFDKRFQKHFGDNELFTALQSMTEWAMDLKARRDPVAHRIPLYVVPSILQPGQETEYQRLSDLHLSAAAKLDFETSEQAFSSLDQLGSYPGWMVHDPNEPPIQIYPTIPEDLGMMLQVSDRILLSLGYNKSLLSS